MLEEEYDYFVKILVIGWDSNITNAPWSVRFQSGTWPYVHHLENGVIVKCDMWNFSYLYKNWTVDYIHNASGAVIVYDIYNENSLCEVSLILDKLKECTRPELIISLVENNSETYKMWKRKISKRTAARFAEINGLLYEDVNWSKNMQIENVFRKLIKAICDQMIDTGNRFLQVSHENNYNLYL